MSRNNKGYRRIKEAQQWSELRKSGSSGPKQTEPKHGKTKVLWKSKATQDARAAVLSKSRGQDGQTVLEKLKGKQQ